MRFPLTAALFQLADLCLVFLHPSTLLTDDIQMIRQLELPLCQIFTQRDDMSAGILFLMERTAAEMLEDLPVR